MKTLFRTLSIVAALVSFAFSQQSMQTKFGGHYWASNYNVNWNISVTQGTASGAGSVVVSSGQVTLPDGRKIVPFAVGSPITVNDGTLTETVVLTGVSGCSSGTALLYQCTLSATFANAHGAGAGVQIISGTAGLQEAINDAHFNGGGVVHIDGSWTGTTAMLTTTTAPVIVYQNVSIEDSRAGAVQNWNPQGGLTTLAAPTTLTALTALPSATPVGAFGTGTYHMCIAYVDVMGQEGPCSADFSEAGLATGSFIFSAPAASAGAVGYTIYIGLTGGGVTNLNYKVPITSTICTLTTVETTTAACAVANTNYGQSGAAATVTAITLNTSPIQPAVTIVSTTAIYVPNAGGRTTYAYVPGSHVGYFGLPGSFLPFTISAADATTVPSVIGTVNLPPGLMNIVGRTIEVCGKATTSASTGTIKDIQFQWDALGQNTAGKGVPIGDLSVTQTSTTVTELTFCDDFQTTVAGAGATAGSINNIGGYIAAGVATLVAGGAGSDTFIGATASLNLASEARLNVIYLHTTGTDGTAVTLQSLTVKVLN